MEACLAANGRYFEKENVKYTVSEGEDDASEYIFCFYSFFSFLFFGGVHVTIFTNPGVTRDLFDVQTYVGACWKGNALKNTCALLELQ